MPATQRSRNLADVLPQAISEHSAGACMVSSGARETFLPERRNAPGGARN
jgi:hypothetical protein